MTRKTHFGDKRQFGLRDRREAATVERRGDVLAQRGEVPGRAIALVRMPIVLRIRFGVGDHDRIADAQERIADAVLDKKRLSEATVRLKAQREAFEQEEPAARSSYRT